MPVCTIALWCSTKQVSQGSLEFLEQWWQLDSQRLFIVVATIWLDRTSQWPLLFTSAIGMTVSLFTLAVGFVFLYVPKSSSNDLPVTTGVQQNPGFVASLATLVICAYVAFLHRIWAHQLGSDIRDFFTATVNASSGIVMNRLLRGTVALTFLSLADAIMIAGVFFLLINYGIVHSLHSLLLPGDKREDSRRNC